MPFPILKPGGAGTGLPPAPPAANPAPFFFTSGVLEQVSAPLRILIGPPTKSATMDITKKVPIDSISIEETGTHDEATASFSIIDKALLYTAMRGEWKIHMQHGDRSVFRGYIGKPSDEIRAIFGEKAVTCRDFGSMLDRLIVKSRFVREAGESDKARIQWLIDTIGQPMVNEGMTSWGKVQVLNGSMPKQWFPPRLTLRQCIERVLAAASDSSNYYVDMHARLHTFDADNPESGWTADKNVNVTTSPGATAIAPEDLSVDWDSDGLVNSFYVRGKNAAGSGWYTDKDLWDEGPYSLDIFGLRSAYIDAPDADTPTKARKVARAALSDTRNPIPRGRYTTFITNTQTPYEAGQLQFVTSPVHGLNGSGADPGPWAGPRGPQPLRIVSVSTKYINGVGDRTQEIEFGGRRIHRYSASLGT